MATELELPGVYVDLVELDATADPRLRCINRDPYNAEVGVPRQAFIYLDLVDVGVSSPDATKTKVWVNGFQAFIGGVFQGDYDNGMSFTDTPYPQCLRICLYNSLGFESLSVVTVEVQSETVDGGATLTTSYSFTIEDAVRPRVGPAEAQALKVVRIAFDEPVLMADPTDTADSLHAANYALAAQTAPAVAVQPVSVAAVDASTVDVTMDIPLTPGATYRVTVANVEDPYGNAVHSPYDTADFVAYTPVRPDRRRFELIAMLPEINLREDDDGTGDLRKFISCLQEPTDLLLDDIDAWTDILDPDKAPEPFLDAMLADLGNPFSFDLAEIDKRRLLRVLVDIYKQKGTARGIVNAVRFFLGIEVTVLEYLDEETLVLGVSELGSDGTDGDWILGPDRWWRYAFEINTGLVVLTDEERQQMTALAKYMKDARTHLARIVEPEAPPVYDHLELGISELGHDGTDGTWVLH